MAAIDYGALLKIDGVFVNKNQDLFMQASNTGYVCEYAEDKNGSKNRIQGNYYVYAGDRDLLLVFYKRCFLIISNEKIVREMYRFNFCRERFDIPGLPSIQVSHLDKKFRKDQYKFSLCDTERRRLTEDHGKIKGRKILYRKAKRAATYKHKSIGFNYMSDRYYATWDYNGHKYEVIFGYGIDPNEEVWNKIKYKERSWEFSDVERETIDSWFA